MAKGRIIPFKFTPAAWGLKGKSYKVAAAEYDNTGEDLDRKLAEIEFEDDENGLQIEFLKIDKKHGKITETELEKEIASIEDEPWVGVLKSEFDVDQGASGLYFELDWNEKFVKLLEVNGYTGVNDDMVVQRWFDDVCKSAAAEEGILEDLVGGEELESEFGAVNRTMTQTTKSKDGKKTAYS